MSVLSSSETARKPFLTPTQTKIAVGAIWVGLFLACIGGAMLPLGISTHHKTFTAVTATMTGVGGTALFVGLGSLLPDCLAWSREFEARQQAQRNPVSSK